jgi:hypothetical protein
MKSLAVRFAPLTLLLLARNVARADSAPGAERDEGAAAPAASQTQVAASSGAFLPFSQPAGAEAGRAHALGLAGYDSARRAGSFEAAAEVRLFGPVDLRGGAVYTRADRALRPSFGARIGLLREARHGLDAAFGVFYRPEGLTEPEGEIESVLSLGRHVGRAYLLGNLLYGQDPEGSERDGEVRLAALVTLRSRLVVGLDSRLRFDLGSQAAKLAEHHEPTMDVAAGPTVAMLLGPVAVSLQGGASALRLQQRAATGAFAMTGIGTAF